MSGTAIVGVVLDCNVLLQAAAREGSAAAACFKLAETGHIRLYVSKATLREVEDVMNRPEVRARFRTLTDERVGAFLAGVRQVGNLVRRVPKTFTYPRDVNDEPYIHLADAAKADYLISRDKDLLHLMTGHSRECKEFRQKFRPLKIVEPQAFLKIFLQNKNSRASPVK
ncbi:MAG: putative toxin-antitoxin system toxin component, PIN family [Blastocatellia bacterium]|nr:putative toxin-antitoxin system toxin component, PIN family [Blastocatellia bacterium]